MPNARLSRMIHLENTASRMRDAENGRPEHPLINEREGSSHRMLVFFFQL